MSLYVWCKINAYENIFSSLVESQCSQSHWITQSQPAFNVLALDMCTVTHWSPLRAAKRDCLTDARFVACPLGN